MKQRGQRYGIKRHNRRKRRREGERDSEGGRSDQEQEEHGV